MAQNHHDDIDRYSPAARAFHWIVAVLILIQFPIGLSMVYRGYEMEAVNDKGEIVKGVWDGVTNTLYSSHKTLGILILLLVVLRLSYRLTHGAPPPDPTVPKALVGISHLTHWSIYLLLLAVPVLGYTGISYGNYLDVFGIPLPAVTAEDKKFSEQVFEFHELAAQVLALLVVLHIGGAIYHRAVRKDRVVERMLPKKTV